MRKVASLLFLLFTLTSSLFGKSTSHKNDNFQIINASDTLSNPQNREDSLQILFETNQLDTLERINFVNDFQNQSLRLFFDQKRITEAWKVCFADDSLRKKELVLRKTAVFLNRNPTKSEFLKTEIQTTSKLQRTTFLSRTWWADSLKSNFDTLANSSGFKTLGIEAKDVKKGILDDMKTEASAPQFVELIINSGKSVPKKVEVSGGYVLYKIIPKGSSAPSLFTPFWAKLEELNKYVADELEQRFGLPIVSHAAKYDVYKIQLKEGKTAAVFESEVAETSEKQYKTTGGAIQSLVLDRTKWTAPQLIVDLEIFPPFKK